MTPPPTLTELIATVQRDAPSHDPLDLLATASRTVTELSTVGDAVLDHFVAGARRDGRSWSEISGVLGVSKQAAHKRFAGPPDPDAALHRFTPRARATVAAAAELSRALGHAHVGAEHLLLSQFTQPESIAARILAGAGIERDTVEARVKAVAPAAPTPPGDEPPAYSVHGAAALAGSVTEALQLGHNYVGTEHLLLALYRDGDSPAATILTDLGLDAAAARTAVAEQLKAVIQARSTP